MENWNWKEKMKRYQELNLPVPSETIKQIDVDYEEVRGED